MTKTVKFPPGAVAGWISTALEMSKPYGLRYHYSPEGSTVVFSSRALKEYVRFLRDAMAQDDMGLEDTELDEILRGIEIVTNMSETKIKIRKTDLKKVLLGRLTLAEARQNVQRLLNEDEVPPMNPGTPATLQNDSLDIQVDKFIMQGDDTPPQQGPELGGSPPAVTQAPAQEGLIREAEGDEAEAPAAGSGKQIDAVKFADNVAHLVEKFNNLVDVRGTVVRRALNYVAKNYDAKQMETVKQVLEGNFGLSVEDSPGTDEFNQDQIPPARGAGHGLNQA